MFLLPRKKTKSFLVFSVQLQTLWYMSCWVWTVLVLVLAGSGAVRLTVLEVKGHVFLPGRSVRFLPGAGRFGMRCTVVMSLQYCTRPGLPGPGVATPRSPPGGQVTRRPAASGDEKRQRSADGLWTTSESHQKIKLFLREFELF